MENDERKHSRLNHWQCREFKNQLERPSTSFSGFSFFELFGKGKTEQVEGATPL